MSKQKPYEEETYPISPEIIYYGDQKFTYVVVQEGVYPVTAQLIYTEAPNHFPCLITMLLKLPGVGPVTAVLFNALYIT